MCNIHAGPAGGEGEQGDGGAEALEGWALAKRGPVKYLKML